MKFKVAISILVAFTSLLVADDIVCHKNVGKLKKEVEELSSRPSHKIPNKYLGEFTITHYCSCPICTGTPKGSRTASGVRPKENRTIAVDKNKIPLGSIVYIEDIGVFVAEDVGGGVKQNKIDIYVEDHNKALKLGTRKKKVYLIK